MFGGDCSDGEGARPKVRLRVKDGVKKGSRQSWQRPKTGTRMEGGLTGELEQRTERERERL